MVFAIPQFEHPLVLLLISPLILAGIFAIRRGVSKWIIFSRIIILSLLIIALASPYSLGISTVRDDAPRITVISDKTLSMDLFNMDMGKKLFDAIQPKTPTKFTEFAGVKSPIGDEVIAIMEKTSSMRSPSFPAQVRECSLYNKNPCIMMQAWKLPAPRISSSGMRMSST
jgi:hypothetical protein